MAPIREFSVPEAQLPLLKQYLAKGDVPVDAESPEEAGPPRGHITFIDNAVDPTTGTIRVKGAFGNADRRLWPGQFVNVTTTLANDPNALVVPSVAVQGGQQGTYVFVIRTTAPSNCGRSRSDARAATTRLSARA